MSSRVLLRQHDSSAVQPMVWRSTNPGSDTNAHLATPHAERFEPSVSLDHETALLRNRLIEMEHSSRHAVEAVRQQAFAEGEAQGRTLADAEIKLVLDRMAHSFDELAKLRPRLREEAESDVVQLSLAIARRILNRELSVDGNAIQALVQVALERLARQEVFRVRIHPAQMDVVRAALTPHHAEVEILPDPRLEIGSLIFETNRGKMDASVAAQFEEIERGLTDRMKSR